ncbi:PfkB family carbohydrate kinase, partial [Paenibacillus sp. Y412MC10]|uniref:PfkB family carbohydrate kinase n=1 Tax=Geobacillus sp. (strain Y412MC10) TaxID=481743 RepID=UPI0021B32993
GRVGGEVRMVGCVGDDWLGERILRNLQWNGVIRDYVEGVRGMERGRGEMILGEGEKRMVVVKGGNDGMSGE